EEQHRVSKRRGSNARSIPLERPKMRQHPVCGGYGLCPLEMCVCRHQHIFERRRLIQHYLLERSGGGIQLRTCVDGPQTGSGRNLIVSTAPGGELGGDVAHFFVEHAVDEW